VKKLDDLLARVHEIQARARRRVERDPLPGAPLPKNVVQLPLWPEPVRAVPNGFLRSALFGAIAKGRRRYIDRLYLPLSPRIAPISWSCKTPSRIRPDGGTRRAFLARGAAPLVLVCACSDAKASTKRDNAERTCPKSGPAKLTATPSGILCSSQSMTTLASFVLNNHAAVTRYWLRLAVH
jgi:hypothetical protein